MGGLTFLDYVKELPKGKREAKGATKGGYATAAAPKKPAAAHAAAATPNGAAAVESTARALPGVEETKGGGGGSEADAIGDKIAAKVRAVTNASNADTINFGFVLFAQGRLQAYLTFELRRCQTPMRSTLGKFALQAFGWVALGAFFCVCPHGIRWAKEAIAQRRRACQSLAAPKTSELGNTHSPINSRLGV